MVTWLTFPPYLVDHCRELDGFTSVEDSIGLAFYSTYSDTVVPGRPVPHPTIEANYYFHSGAVPSRAPSSSAA